MSRPNIGTLKGAASFDDESYLDFVEGLRGFNLSRMMPRLVQAGDAVGASMAEASPRGTPQDLFRALDRVPAAQMARRMMRSTQQMMWHGAGSTYRRISDDLEGAVSRMRTALHRT